MIVSSHFASAQHSILSSALSTSARSLGQAGICDWNPTSGLMNPANLSNLQFHSFSLESHNYYFINGLYTFAAHGAYRLNEQSAFGAIIISDGSQELRDWLFSIVYGRKIGAKTGIGINIDYLQTQTPESEDLRNVSFELGLQTQLLPSLLVGFVLKNPIPIKSSSLHPYPVVFKAGLNYKVYEQLQVLAEVHKHGNHKTSFHGGLRYIPVPPLSFSIGISTLGPSLSIGAGFKLKNAITLNSALDHHTLLGISSSLGFTYQFR